MSDLYRIILAPHTSEYTNNIVHIKFSFIASRVSSFWNHLECPLLTFLGSKTAYIVWEFYFLNIWKT